MILIGKSLKSVVMSDFLQINSVFISDFLQI